MVAAACYNMLDVRSMHGRSKTHDVSEATYKQPGHHFGRVPIVIHLGDFLQLAPTANIGLVEDVNAKNDDGSYKYAEPPSVEIQHAIKNVWKHPARVRAAWHEAFQKARPADYALGVHAQRRKDSAHRVESVREHLRD